MCGFFDERERGGGRERGMDERGEREREREGERERREGEGRETDRLYNIVICYIHYSCLYPCYVMDEMLYVGHNIITSV